VYDNDLADIDEIGWDRFVYGAWEAIFLGYRSFGGIRSIGRQWSDLLQGGLDCPAEIADSLVHDQVIIREDRNLIAIKDAERLMAAMSEILADMGSQLAELPAISPADRDRLLAAHQTLTEYLQANFC
jgi:hypothetical protein